MSNDNLIQNYVILSSLRKNIEEKSHYIHEKYIEQFNEIIEEIEKEGYSLDKFKIPERELKTNWSSYSPSEGYHYKDYREVETMFFLTKLDGLLSYFSIITSPMKTEIGFKL